MTASFNVTRFAVAPRTALLAEHGLRNLNLHQLRCFVATAEEQHFRRAAARLRMSQSPLSRQIQLLEESVGVRLFEREGRAVRLTQAGQRLLLESRRILDCVPDMGWMTAAEGTGPAETLRMGFVGGAEYRVLPRLIGLCRSHLPRLTLSLEEAVSPAGALRDGRLNVALMRPPLGSQIDSICLSRELFVAALPSGDSRTRLAAVAPADLHDRPFVMYDSHQAGYFHDAVANMLAAHNAVPRPVQHVGHIHCVLALVEAGSGAALVPESAATPQAGLDFRPLACDTMPVELHLAWRTGMRAAAVAGLIALMRSGFDGKGETS